MRVIGTAIGLAVICAGTGIAQSQETTTKTKIEVKDGKDMTVTGCVQRMADDKGFMLIDNADRNGTVHRYVLVTDEVDLSKHVGHRVEISGKAADRGDGEVETRTTTTTKIEDGEDKKTETKTKVKGDLEGLPIFGVKALKMISSSCS